MGKPHLLDLFCGAGGAGEGYARAGFEVIGCDLDAKPLHHNPHECYQGDALEVLDTLLAGEAWQGYHLRDFAMVRASPPCQDYSSGSSWLTPARPVKLQHPRLIVPVRERLMRTGLPWEIENVRNALPDMLNPVMLCGTMFGLRVQRHRIFDSSHLLFAAGACHHQPYDVSVRKHRTEYLGLRTNPHTMPSGEIRYRNPHCPIIAARSAMGIDWMNSGELGEAIPPAYTEFLGRQLYSAIESEAVA
jgi:DNA (cytosine-5)-methyltransferase 1